VLCGNQSFESYRDGQTDEQKDGRTAASVNAPAHLAFLQGVESIIIIINRFL